MRIIIEGCDGVGKTTVCKMLAEHYGFDLVHFTGGDPKDDAFYKQTLRKENVVYDRHYIGELVYPIIFNRSSALNFVKVKKGIASVERAYFFVLYASTNVIKERIKQRSETECAEILNNLEYINSKFISLAKELDVPIIDTTNQSPTHIINNIINFIDEKENEHA